MSAARQIRSASSFDPSPRHHFAGDPHCVAPKAELLAGDFHYPNRRHREPSGNADRNCYHMSKMSSVKKVSPLTPGQKTGITPGGGVSKVAVIRYEEKGEGTVFFEVESAEDAKSSPLAFLRAASRRRPAMVLIAPAGPAHDERKRPMSELIEAMMPSTDVPTPVEVLQARRNAEARWGLLSEFGALTSAQVAEAAGSKAANTAALASRWLRSRDVLAVTYNGTRYFPGFQFDEAGKPLPIVREVLEHLEDLGEWQRAIWFVTRSRLLGDERPVDLMREHPEQLVAAARASAEPID